MSSYERQPRLPSCTDCPICRSQAAIFRAHLAGSRFYCARCRKTFNAPGRQPYSTGFSLGPVAGGGSLADTVAFVPDTKADVDVRVEQTSELLPAVRLPSVAAERRAKSRPLWRQLVRILARFLRARSRMANNHS